jgi:hypothetical protein
MNRRPYLVSFRARLAGLLFCSSATLFLGCGQSAGDHPPVYAVNGKVLYKGKPISAGVVLFELERDAPAFSSSGPLRATGRIEADGSFRLMTFQGVEGAPAGSYRVGISSIPPRSEANILDASTSARKGNPDVLKGRYSDPRTSGLRTEVLKDKTNEPTFDLK